MARQSRDISMTAAYTAQDQLDSCEAVDYGISENMIGLQHLKQCFQFLPNIKCVRCYVLSLIK